jgi:acetolactate synthase-1/2/3 large subunit
MNGAQALLEGLLREGVDVVFGYPGGAVLPLYDALYDAPIRHVLVRHEQGAIHAADGYARASGSVGVCLVTSGPGATNLVTGLANAWMDSIPVVAISGQVSRALLGTDAFQEADVTGITRVVTKHNVLVDDAESLIDRVAEAFEIARSGRPGPVLLDVPKDVQLATVTARAPRLRHRIKPAPTPDDRQIEAAARAMAEARRPLMLVGGGVIHANAAPALRALVSASGIPVASTLMGLGALPGTHPAHIGLVGMHGTYAANRATHRADLIIGLGLRFDDRVTGMASRFAPEAQIIHADIDPAEIGKVVRADFPVLGDLAVTLPRLTAAYLKARAARGGSESEAYRGWWQDIRAWQEHQGWDMLTPMELGGVGGQPLRPQGVIQAVYRATDGNALVATDVGQHQMWTALLYPLSEPRQWLTSGGLGTMGYGLPAALGAAMARPDRDVWLITGDGSIQMNLQEMATAVNYGLKVRVVIINNNSLGMVRQWQELFHQARYSAVEMTALPNWELIAQAYGWYGRHVETRDELMAALDEMRRAPGPALLDVRVAQQENVFPMVPAGRALEETLLEKPVVDEVR